jgi:hypothetical protein
VLYHTQGLIPKRFLELKASNKIYEKHGGRGKKFFSYPKRPDSLHPPAQSKGKEGYIFSTRTAAGA